MGSRTAGLWLVAVFALACADAGGPDDGGLRVTRLVTPGAAGSAQPSLAPTHDGRVLLTWHEPDGAGHALRFATLADTTWSAPTTVASGRDFIVNWADFPSALDLGEGRLVVHWLEREGSDTYAYGVRVAFSSDSGRTWSEPVRPHDDSTQTEHGFVSLLPDADGSVAAIWLDGRNFESNRPRMTLRAAQVAPGAVADAAVLDERICDCCQTDAALTSDGAVVVYRDRSEDEIRDIALVRRTASGWSEPALVHADGWQIDGCPVNGPAVAADGDLVAVAWFTAARDTAKVLLAFSHDAGAGFGDAVRIDGGDPTGRVDVVLLDRERALVSWIEQGEAGAEVRVRTVHVEEGAGAATSVAPTSSARASGFPRMTRAGRDVVIAWTDVDEGRVKAARLDAGD